MSIVPRRWVLCAGMLLAACLVATPSAAQCQLDVSAYADGDFGEYNGNGESDLSFWGNGFDYSSCPPPYYCPHDYEISVTLSLQPGQEVLVVVNGTSEAYSSLFVGPGTYRIDVLFRVWCDCYNGWIADVPADQTVQLQCAVPNNFRQIAYVEDNVGGNLDFTYTWDVFPPEYSRSALAACKVGEYTTYPSNDDPFPWPAPFPFISSPNPTLRDQYGDTAALGDVHNMPGQFITPYFNNTITSSQIYWFSCPCYQNGAWQTMMGPHPIERVVENVNGWRFRVSKTGKTATKTLP